MRRDPTQFRERFKRWKEGLPAYKNGKPVDDEEFESFRQTLPENQKPIGDYRTRRYWELNDKPKTFSEAIGKGMYTLGNSGKYGQYDIEIPSWHANSVAYDATTGNYEFMKPNSHPTRWMENVYGYWGPDNLDFRENYKLEKGAVYDKYVPKKNVWKLPKFDDGKDNAPIDGGIPFEITVTGRDRRPAWKRMYQNPYLGDTSQYYNGNALEDAISFVPGVGDATDAVKAADAVNRGNYLEAGMLGAGLLLPNILEKPVKKIAPKLFNRLKNIKRKLGRSYYNKTDFLPHNIADEVAEKTTPPIIIPPNRTEKQRFLSDYASYQSKDVISLLDLKDITGLDLSKAEDINRMMNLAYENPEYTKYLQQMYSATNTPINPYSQEVLNQFFRRQGTSLRGVHAQSKDDAIRYLTETEKGRFMGGGDRLQSDGGLYTSNSYTVGDRFKNSQLALENGYVGKLFFDLNIDKSLSPEQQLLQYRKKIYPAANSNPLGNTPFYSAAYDDAVRNGAVALEADYVGRANRGKAGYERVYLPKNAGKDRPVLIVELQEYGESPDMHGRWMNNGDIDSGDGLFISRLLNGTTDFINLARSFLSGKKIKDFEAIRQKRNLLYDLFGSQVDKRNYLLNKLMTIANNIDLAKNALKIAGTGTLGVVGAASILNKIGNDRRFMESPEFLEYTENATNENADSLHDVYYNKYKNRIKNRRAARKLRKPTELQNK